MSHNLKTKRLSNAVNSIGLGIDKQQFIDALAVSIVANAYVAAGANLDRAEEMVSEAIASALMGMHRAVEMGQLDAA